MRLIPELRRALVKAVKKGLNKSFVAKAFDVTRKTVNKWVKRAKHRGKEYFKDKPRKAKESKITEPIEISIITLRLMFKWGTAKIQQGLISLPNYIKEKFKELVQGIKLSRTSINGVLKRHKLNGYYSKSSSWKFFRAKKPNELFQLDIKGYFKVNDKKYWMLVCIDDYSRYVLIAETFDHCLKTKEITSLLYKFKIKPKKILTDNAKVFGKTWKIWCRENFVEPIFAHPYYPQDKGKVERVIRTIGEEFINLLKRFPEWLNNLTEYRDWHNNERFHRGIKSYPAKLYVCS